ncbi:Riboflavin synthase [Serratia symbiotica]|nr:Riboflavin synthase [Serratia symbiotica]
MFSGIIQDIVPLIGISEKNNCRTHIIKMSSNLLSGLKLGSSVAHNGCCLTIVSIKDKKVSFDLIKETLDLTNLGKLILGDKINIECAIKYHEEIGGHLISGHIICTAEITKILTSKNNYQIWFRISNQKLMKYIHYKGFIAIDGISLTIGEVINNLFCVYLIPETLKRTTLGIKKLNDIVNIEINQQTQTIVDTIERILTINKIKNKINNKIVF